MGLFDSAASFVFDKSTDVAKPSLGVGSDIGQAEAAGKTLGAKEAAASAEKARKGSAPNRERVPRGRGVLLKQAGSEAVGAAAKVAVGGATAGLGGALTTGTAGLDQAAQMGVEFAAGRLSPTLEQGLVDLYQDEVPL